MHHLAPGDVTKGEQHAAGLLFTDLISVLSHDDETAICFHHLGTAGPAADHSTTRLLEGFLGVGLVDILNEREGHVAAVAADLDITLAIVAEFSHEAGLQLDVLAWLGKAEMMLVELGAGGQPDKWRCDGGEN